MCPSSWKLYLDDFPFFGSSLARLEPELELFEVLKFGTLGVCHWRWWWFVAHLSPKLCKSICKNVFKAPVSATVASSSSRKKKVEFIIFGFRYFWSESDTFDTFDLAAILLVLLIWEQTCSKSHWCNLLGRFRLLRTSSCGRCTRSNPKREFVFSSVFLFISTKSLTFLHSQTNPAGGALVILQPPHL